MRWSPLLLLGACAIAACSTQSGDDANGGGDGDGVVGEVQEFGTGPKLAFDEYSVLFTNPLCKKYSYPADKEVVSNGGERLLAKPENAFCAPSDAVPSA